MIQSLQRKLELISGLLHTCELQDSVWNMRQKVGDQDLAFLEIAHISCYLTND